MKLGRKPAVIPAAVAEPEVEFEFDRAQRVPAIAEAPASVQRGDWRTGGGDPRGEPRVFGYSNRPDVDVWQDTSGCQFSRNGYTIARSS